MARAAAKKLVVYQRGTGGQSRFFSASAALTQIGSRPECAAYAQRNLDTPLAVRQLTEAAHLSPRQFSRALELDKIAVMAGILIE
jgi:transcriptional regulator GlxA family with amidase domain